MRAAALLDLLANFEDEPVDRFVEVFHERFEEPIEAPAVELEDDIPSSPFVRREDETPPPLDIDALVEAVRREEQLAADARIAQRLAAQARKKRLSTARLMQWKRRQWVQQEAMSIAAGLISALCDMEERMGGQIEAIMTPFIAEGARALCLQAFKSCVREMMTAAAAGPLKLRGPDDLVTAIAAELADQGMRVVAEPLDTIEVTALLDDTVMETCLASFSRALGVSLATDSTARPQKEGLPDRARTLKQRPASSGRGSVQSID